MGESRWAVAEGGPELAAIGTGDILSGMIAAFWAAGQDAETAVRSTADLVPNPNPHRRLPGGPPPQNHPPPRLAGSSGGGGPAMGTLRIRIGVGRFGLGGAVCPTGFLRYRLSIVYDGGGWSDYGAEGE